MFRYELKKVFSKPSSKIALVLLAAMLCITCWFAADVSYVNESGETEHGFAAVRQLREEQKAWAGILDEAKLRQVIAENQRINETPQAQSKDARESDIAYSWRQGISEIRDLINYAYAEEFRTYDYYRADTVTEDDAADFYTNRIMLLKAWLADEAEEQFSQPEKEYLIRQYEELDTPFVYDYMKGWTQLFEYAPTVVMIVVLVLGYLVSGIFSSEFRWKSDAIFFAAVYGRNRAVSAKVKAGVAIVTVVYWFVVLLYSGVVLLYLGADGAACPVQADFSGWKCFYHI